MEGGGEQAGEDEESGPVVRCTDGAPPCAVGRTEASAEVEEGSVEWRGKKGCVSFAVGRGDADSLPLGEPAETFRLKIS